MLKLFYYLYDACISLNSKKLALNKSNYSILNNYQKLPFISPNIPVLTSNVLCLFGKKFLNKDHT